MTNSTSTFDTNEHSDTIQPSSSSSSTALLVTPKSFPETLKTKSTIAEEQEPRCLLLSDLDTERPQSAGANLSSQNSTPKSPKKMVKPSLKSFTRSNYINIMR